MLLYLITNAINGKQYVGITNGTLRARFNSHLLEASRARVPLHLAMAKYGSGAFRIEQLSRASSRDELCEMERQEIARRGCVAPAGYNLTPGGDGQAPGYVPTAKTRELLAERSRSSWASLTPEQRATRCAAISAAKRGTAPQHKSRRSLKGTTREDAFRAKVSEGVKRMIADLPPGEMSRRAKCRN